MFTTATSQKRKNEMLKMGINKENIMEMMKELEEESNKSKWGIRIHLEGVKVKKVARVLVLVSINEDALQNVSQASPTPHCGTRPQQFLPSKQHHKPGRGLDLPTKRMQGQRTTTVLARRLYRRRSINKKWLSQFVI